jgi:hypothetical protein
VVGRDACVIALVGEVFSCRSGRVINISFYFYCIGGGMRLVLISLLWAGLALGKYTTIGCVVEDASIPSGSDETLALMIDLERAIKTDPYKVVLQYSKDFISDFEIAAEWNGEGVCETRYLEVDLKLKNRDGTDAGTIKISEEEGTGKVLGTLTLGAAVHGLRYCGFGPN